MTISLKASLAINEIAHLLRLKILCLLGDAEIGMQDIADEVAASQRIFQHLVHSAPASLVCVSEG